MVLVNFFAFCRFVKPSNPEDLGELYMYGCLHRDVMFVLVETCRLTSHSSHSEDSKKTGGTGNQPTFTARHREDILN